MVHQNVNCNSAYRHPNDMTCASSARCLRLAWIKIVSIRAVQLQGCTDAA